jgi:uncharacterized protein
MIPRLHTDTLKRRILESDKVIILYGPRQVGKTTLIRSLLADLPYRALSLSADEIRYTEALGSRDLNRMLLLVEGYELLFIDEAQRIPDIGINLKLLHDALPKLKIIATGSSSFELANRTKEPLTGRTWTFNLFPIALCELHLQENSFELDERLESLLRFGSYPGVLNLGNEQDKIQSLQELAGAYLYKDILEMSNIRHADKLRNLLRLLAFQVGSEVSFNELSGALGMSKDTVAHYIDLLEKAFVIFRLSGFNRNLRKEISKMDKVYFYDLGIRNSLIENFSPLAFRNDQGQLWENFLIAERMKKNAYQSRFVKSYFWRTHTGAELDYVEEGNGALEGFEFKYSKKAYKSPESWRTNYPEATFGGINRDNYLSFVL